MNAFINSVKKFVATGVASPYAIRNQGKGVSYRCRDYLVSMDLLKLRCMTIEEFAQWLDDNTNELTVIINERTRPWGAARKAINLFLRDALYNKYLCSEYSLETVEQWLEVPMDSVVAKALKRKAGRGRFPAWPGLKNLSPEINDIFQSFASKIAQQTSMHRVHLDVQLWVENRK